MALTVNPFSGSGPAGARAFAERHPADALFFPAMVAALWLLLLAGFVPEVVERAFGAMRPYPWIIHVHAVVYFGWLAFLASQVALVRTGRLARHRQMGAVGLGLALAVIVAGPAASFEMHMSHQARQPPAFLAIQLLNVFAFAVGVCAALLLRHRPAAHKRLMLIATLPLIGAGFGRVVRMLTGAPPPFTLIPSVYVATNAFLLAIAVYDWRTRGRLHPVFLPAVGGLFVIELTAGLLLRSPAWASFTRSLVG
jgi:hypothetical protein